MGLPPHEKAIFEYGQIAKLPDHAHERTVAENILVWLKDRLEKKPNRTPEEEEIIVKIEGNWKHARKLGRAEGRAEGEARALIDEPSRAA